MKNGFVDMNKIAQAIYENEYRFEIALINMFISSTTAKK